MDHRFGAVGSGRQKEHVAGSAINGLQQPLRPLVVEAHIHRHSVELAGIHDQAVIGAWMDQLILPTLEVHVEPAIIDRRGRQNLEGRPAIARHGSGTVWIAPAGAPIIAIIFRLAIILICLEPTRGFEKPCDYFRPLHVSPNLVLEREYF